MEHGPTPEQIAEVEYIVDHRPATYADAWREVTGSIPVVADEAEISLPSVGAPRDPHPEETWTPHRVLDTMPDLSGVRNPYKD